jgi:hypothetical protein
MSAFYNFGKGEILKANIDLVDDIIKVAFMAPAYTPDIDAHDYYSDISASIAAGSADQTLASKTVTVDDTNNRAEFDAADLSIANETITGGTDMMVLYKDTGNPATSPLICYIDIAEGTLTPIDGTLAIAWNSEGIFAF